MIKNVFFDKNNCLIHIDTKTHVAVPSAMKEILKGFNTSASTRDIVEADRKTVVEIVNVFGQDSVKIYDYKLYLTYFLKNFFIRPTDAELEAAYKILFESRASNMRAEDGARQTLKDLKAKGLKLCVLTNSYYERALYHLKSVGLLDYLDFVVTSDLVGSTKSDPKMYRTAMGFTGSKPEESLFVTSVGGDVANALSAGMRTVLISPKPSSAGSDFRIKNIAGLPEIPLFK